MNIIYTDSYKAMSEEAYQVVKRVINDNSNPVINTTTGASFDGMFERLVIGINQGEVEIEKAFIMNLDEYIAPRDASFTVYRYMHNKLYNLINKQPKRIELLDGSTDNIVQEIARYGKILRDNPRDLQILGLGVNGHLGANEPGTPAEATLFLADSVESTIQSTMLYNNLARHEAPVQMLTLGLADIMSARQILVTASGTRKAQAVKEMLEGPISEKCPASLLQRHANVTLILDRDAASLLSKSAVHN
jgi:glucosamine-6-phosphate deaminase